MSFLNLFLVACVLSFTWAVPLSNTNNGKEVDSPKSRARSAENKPNILLIMADDIGTGDIPSYWNSSLVDMPNLRRLSTMKVTFRDAHSTPLCAPSRYVLLSGNYAHRGMKPNGSWGLLSGQNQFQDGQKSIAEVLRDRGGYHTTMLGKWHLGAKAPPVGIQTVQTDLANILTKSGYSWDLPLIQGPQDIGFDSSYMTIGGIQSPPYSFFRDGYLSTNPLNITFWKEGKHNSPNGESIIVKPGEGDVNWDSAAYNMILVNETISFIDNHLENRADDPFFAYVALGAAHLPHSPPRTYLDGSRVKNEYQTRHLDMLLEMDKAVGSLITKIEDEKLANNTVIIFTSDNGGLGDSERVSAHRTSGPLRGKKTSIYEGGHRVPLMIRYDGIFPQNEERNHLVGLNDIYRTVVDLARIDEVPYGSAQDSVSFANYIASGTNTSGLRQHIGTWAYTEGIMEAHAVRHGNMKLVHNIEKSNYELYDLDNDLSETIDLSQDVRYTELMRGMYEKLIELGPCPDDSEGTFSLSKRRESGEDDEDEKVSCKWFNIQTKLRCKMHIEGELLCNSVCGREMNRNMCDAVRSGPPMCTDSPLFMRVNTRARSCGWVSRNIENRCHQQGVASHCPGTCNSTQFCTKDSSNKIRLTNRKFTTCKWVKRLNTALRCKMAGVAKTCRKICSSLNTPPARAGGIVDEQLEI